MKIINLQAHCDKCHWETGDITRWQFLRIYFEEMSCMKCGHKLLNHWDFILFMLLHMLMAVVTVAEFVQVTVLGIPPRRIVARMSKKNGSYGIEKENDEKSKNNGD